MIIYINEIIIIKQFLYNKTNIKMTDIYLEFIKIKNNNNYNIFFNTWLNLYKFFLFLDLDNEIFLNIAGIKLVPIGKRLSIPKLTNVSMIKWIWVYLYTAQKQPK